MDNAKKVNYLLRFDDICPTMNWEVWNRIESLLIKHKVSPILAVVPDNRDPGLVVGPPLANFWERVRSWQSRGWSIGLHGFQHCYVNNQSGILKLNKRSEFAGLPCEEQASKLAEGLSIFTREGVTADCWVAPAHSFDWNTVYALSQLGVKIISDGFSFSPYRDVYDTIWIPQQFASMRRMPRGLWTFCYHHNHMDRGDLMRFKSDLQRLSPYMIGLPEAISFASKKRAKVDKLVGFARLSISAVRRFF